MSVMHKKNLLQGAERTRRICSSPAPAEPLRRGKRAMYLRPQDSLCAIRSGRTDLNQERSMEAGLTALIQGTQEGGTRSCSLLPAPGLRNGCLN